MKKFLFLCIVVCLQLKSYSQNQMVNIRGTSYAQKDSSRVENVVITLSINDSIQISENTDRNGNYEFNLKRFKGTVKLMSSVTKDSRSVKHKNTNFISSRDTRVIDLNGNSNYRADFFIKENDCTIPKPQWICFKENSLDLENDTALLEIPSEIAFAHFFQVAKDNPETVIEIVGHCTFNEKNKNALSLKRAELIKTWLCASGLEKDRFKCKGDADKSPFVAQNTIKLESNKLEKEKLNLKNRTVTMLILSFDYGPEKVKTPVLKDDEE